MWVVILTRVAMVVMVMVILVDNGLFYPGKDILFIVLDRFFPQAWVKSLDISREVLIVIMNIITIRVIIKFYSLTPSSWRKSDRHHHHHHHHHTSFRDRSILHHHTLAGSYLRRPLSAHLHLEHHHHHHCQENLTGSHLRR